MTVTGGWIFAALVLGAVFVGWGLLLDAATRSRVPAALVPGVGLSAVIVAGGLGILVAPRVVAPVVAMGALAGLWVGRGRLRTLDRGMMGAAALAAGGTYIVYALPTVVHGGVLAGFGRLDDSATWLALTDNLLTHGREVPALGPGSYPQVLRDYLDTGYPLGSLLPVALTARLSGQDAANVFQPVIAVYGSVMACSLWAVARSLIRSPAAAAAAALAAAQASLVFGYAQWGGIKELASAALVATVAPLVVLAWRRDGARTMALVIISCGALAGVLGVDGAPWALPAGLVALAGWLRASGRPPPWSALAGLSVLAVLVAVPALVALELLKVSPLPGNEIVGAERFGRLLRVLNPLQSAGVWPQADFRTDAASPALFGVLAVGVLGVALAGAVVAARAGVFAPAVLLAVAGSGTALIVALGTPWIDAKAYAVLSPMVLLVALATLARTSMAALMPDHRSPAVMAAPPVLAILTLAVAVSTVAVTRGAPVAPRGEFAELARIGDRFAGQGPTLVLSNAVYASRHFLRAADVEGASDRRVRFVYLRSGMVAPNYSDVRVDAVAPADLAVYRTLVRRRGAPGAAPPAYAKRFNGRYWEVWQRR